MKWHFPRVYISMTALSRACRGLQRESSDHQFIFPLGTQNLFLSSREVCLVKLTAYKTANLHPNAINSVGEKGKNSI